MKLRSDYRGAVMMKNRLHHESGEPIEEPIHPGQQRRIQQGQEVFSEDTSPPLEFTNIQDGNIGLHLQALRGGTHPDGLGSELTIFLLESLFFCYTWFRLQLIAIHCNQRGMSTEHPHTVIFSCTSHMCLHHIVAQGVAARFSWKTCSSTCRHVSDRSLSLFALISSSLSCVSTFLRIVYISSILVIILHVVGTAEHKNSCAPAEWGVLLRGDTKPSHRCWAANGRFTPLLICGTL